MTNTIIFLTIVTVAIVVRVYMLRKSTGNTTASSTTTPGSETLASKAKAWILTKAKDNWKAMARAAAILVGCHFLVQYFWPELWSGLAKTFVFWLDHIVLIVAFLFFREKDKKGKMVYVPGVSWALTALLVGNIWMAWGWSESYYREARTKAMAEYQQAIATREAAEAALPTEYTAPVGKFSEKIINTYGMVVIPHGPILLQTDKEMVERDDVVLNKEMTPLMKPARWVRFQSRTTEPVKVTVSR
ncbi:MAG: hypothetical protein QG579_64 [Patescibacteria group bacterium]|jgi:hypothetical protein|nr:hypothetical protein [Patescibacteria group bacterium]